MKVAGLTVKKITIDEIDDYIKGHPNEKTLEPFFAEAFAFGADVYTYSSIGFYIVARLPEMTYTENNITKQLYFYMSVEFDYNTVFVAVATEENGDIIEGGTIDRFDITEGFKTILYKAAHQANFCSYCKKEVGYQNIIDVGYRRVCKDCEDAAMDDIMNERFSGY